MERYPTSGLPRGGRREAARGARSSERLGAARRRALLSSKWYPGAIERFKATARRAIPTSPAATRRYFYLADSFEKIQRPAEALPYYDRLLKEFEKSEFLAEAQKRAELIRSDMAKKTEGLPKDPA